MLQYWRCYEHNIPYHILSYHIILLMYARLRFNSININKNGGFNPVWILVWFLRNITSLNSKLQTSHCIVSSLYLSASSCKVLNMPQIYYCNLQISWIAHQSGSLHGFARANTQRTVLHRQSIYMDFLLYGPLNGSLYPRRLGKCQCNDAAFEWLITWVEAFVTP
jgi:hypothetical protein